MQPLRRVAPFVAAIAALACLSSYAFLGWYSRWIADDFCTAAAMKSEGFWRSQATMYQAWSGRFAFTFTINAIESFGPAAARVVPAAVIIAWIAAAAFAARRLLQTPWPLAIATGVIFVCAAIESAPTVFQSVLWQTGALTYLAPLVLLTWWSASLARDRVTVAAVALPFLAGAFSETSVVCQVAALSVALIIGPPAKRRIIAAALGSSMVVLAIVALSPGNAIRRAQLPPSPEIIQTIQRTAVATYDFVSYMIVTNAMSLLLVCAVAALVRRVRVPGRIPLTAFVAAVGASAAASFSAIHMMASNPPGRALVVPETLLVVAAAALGLYVAPRLEPAAAVLAIVLALVPVAGAIHNIHLIPAAQELAEKWDRMDVELRASRGDSVVAMPATIDMLHFVNRDPAHWSNQCISRYYGISSIRSH